MDIFCNIDWMVIIFNLCQLTWAINKYYNLIVFYSFNCIFDCLKYCYKTYVVYNEHLFDNFSVYAYDFCSNLLIYYR